MSEPIDAVIDLTPYTINPIPGGRSVGGNAPAAGQFLHHILRPGNNSIFQLKKFIIGNSDAAAISVSVRLAGVPTIIAAGLTTVTAPSPLVNLCAKNGGTQPGLEATLGLYRINTKVGPFEFCEITIPATSQVQVDLPDPGVFLFGGADNEPGANAMLFVAGTDAKPQRVVVYGCEWRK